jgi:hypothetical protein
VVALGSPLSLSNSVTSGVVSNPNRDGTEIGLNNELYYIQTDTIVTVIILINILKTSCLSDLKHFQSMEILVAH